MKREIKYRTRRQLESFSEEEFAKYLIGKGYLPFFPYKDTGIDMAALKGGKIEFYQLKSRIQSLRHEGKYRFKVWHDIKKLKKAHISNAFFILCALQPDEGRFDFFKVPLKVVEEYFRKNVCKSTSFLDIQKLDKNEYEIRPKYIMLNINKYRLR
jgi:hypothetical protein